MTTALGDPKPGELGDPITVSEFQAARQSNIRSGLLQESPQPPVAEVPACLPHRWAWAQAHLDWQTLIYPLLRPVTLEPPHSRPTRHLAVVVAGLRTIMVIG